MYQRAMKWRAAVVVAAAIGLWALSGPAQAAVYNLRADEVLKTMPDGRQVWMWGFACDSATAPAVCPNQGIVTVPGPELVVDPADPNLTINLTNNLPEPISIIIPAQAAPLNPVYHTTGQYTGRVRSLTDETAPAATGQYTWTGMKPGTFLYESGSHLAVQVPMGLYGAVRMDQAAGFAYAGIDYLTQATFLFSEVDPALNDAVAGTDPLAPVFPATYGTAAFPSSIHFTPRYFLVNGEPFPSGLTHTYVGAAGSRVLLRFLNAGLAMRSPAIVDAHLQVVAEDGNPYAVAKNQYTMDLAAGKTFDAIGTFADGYYPIFDRRLGLTNNDATTGGMFAYLEVGPGHTTNEQAILNVTKAGTGTGLVVSSSLPGGIDCGLTCSQHYLPGTELRVTAKAAQGSVFASWTGCDQVINLTDCVVALPVDVVATPQVTITATFAGANATVGVYRGGAWYLDKGSSGWTPGTDGTAQMGQAGDIAVTADVNGDGFTEIGVFREGRWYFDADNSGAFTGCPINDGTDLCLTKFGRAGDIPVTGDWDGDGRDEVGVFRGGSWYFDMDGDGLYNSAVDAFRSRFGQVTDKPVTGDWDGDGRTEIGVYRGGIWYLDLNGNGRWDGTPADVSYQFGQAADLPAPLDWNADGKTELAIFRPSNATWYLDDGSGAFVLGLDAVVPFGMNGDSPVTGTWR